MCGVTATAHKKDGGEQEQNLFKKFSLTTVDLFKDIDFPLADDWSSMNYSELRIELTDEKYRGFAKLVLGKYDTIQSYCGDDFTKFIRLDMGPIVDPLLWTTKFYYLKDLTLAWSTDFWPSKEHGVKGIILIILSKAPNWWVHQQWLGRVGRQGDPCFRIRVTDMINAEHNVEYVQRLKELDGLGIKEIKTQLNPVVVPKKTSKKTNKDYQYFAPVDPDPVMIHKISQLWSMQKASFDYY